MSKHPQNRFPRLKIVASTDKTPRRQLAERRWWGPQPARSRNLNQEASAAPAPSHAMPTMVMPLVSRNLLFMAIHWSWNFLCGYFADTKQRQRGAAVLSFRRQAIWAQENLAGKKASGSVAWDTDCEAAPQEGGRG